MVEDRKIKENSFVQAARYVYPVATFTGASALLHMYTRPSSVFLRSFLLLLTTTTAWWIGVRKERKELNIFLLKNYKHFSWPVQRALQTGDSRYLREILRKNNIIETPKAETA